MILRWLGIGILAAAITACSSSPEQNSDEVIFSEPLPKTDTLREDANAIVVRLGEQNEVMVDGKMIHIDSLESELIRAQKLKGEDAVISLHQRVLTNVELYIRFQLAVEKNLMERREAASMKTFNEHYYHLEKKKRDIIDARYKLRILENRPH